jgi:hypothetical protein
MTWVRLDDGFPDHPKLVAAGGDAGWLHICAMCWSARQLTDGVIPAGILHRLSDRRRPEELAARLVACGLWEVTEGGWTIHDWFDYQPSRERVEADRQAAQQRMRRTRSQNVRPNIDRTNTEVRPNIDRSSENVRLPRPDPSLSTSSFPTTTTVETVAEDRSSSSSGMNQPSVITEAVALAVEVAAMHTDGIRSPGRWRKRVAETIATEHGEAMRAHVAERPGISAGQLVQAVLGATDIDVARARQLRGAS